MHVSVPAIHMNRLFVSGNGKIGEERGETWEVKITLLEKMDRR